MPRSAQSWASSPSVRKSMQSNRPRDTAPERALRSGVHALGLRYRVGARPVPGLRRIGDLVFTRARAVVFLDGCFWHGCPDHHTAAKTNAGYWADKVEQNRLRDRETDRLLADAGWAVLRVWEHEPVADAAARVAALVHTRIAELERAARKG